MRLEISADEAAIIIREHLVANNINPSGEVSVEEDAGGYCYFAAEINPSEFINYGA